MDSPEKLESLTLFDSLKAFVLLYLISIGIMFYISKRTGTPFIVPGDIYNLKQGRRMYIPTGGAFFLTLALYVLLLNLRTKFGG